MARNRIGKQASEKLDYNFAKRPKAKSGLFGKEMNSPLTKAEQSYFQVVEMIKADKGELTLKQLSHFFVKQYRHIYGNDCIDYNWFNFSTTMKNCRAYLGIESNLELAKFLVKSFDIYPKIRSDLKLTESQLTLSTLKRAFIVEALESGKSKKFDGFY
nr:MAG TPA: hypothetical protein [Caudoviricetes sp.]